MKALIDFNAVSISILIDHIVQPAYQPPPAWPGTRGRHIGLHRFVLTIDSRLIVFRPAVNLDYLATSH
jgi:hypothetical protein